MIKLLIIADDFTGALDTGVHFSQCGAITHVITGNRFDIANYCDSCDVLVVDAETRHVSAEKAYANVYDIVAQAMTLQIPHIYKKTDSALRGNVGAEIAAVLDASKEDAIPFMPAFPQMERNTIQGIHYIAGVPVDQSVFGKDPFEPVRHSRIPELISEQTLWPVQSYPAISVGDELPKERGIWVFDASCLEDLVSVGNCLKKAHRLHIMAGCAGFGAVLPSLLSLDAGIPRPVPPLDSEFTIICGSVNPITISQILYAKDHGAQHKWLTPEQKLDPNYWDSLQGKEKLQELNQILEIYPLRILDTNDWDNNTKTVDYAAQNNMTIQDVRKAVSGTIGHLVSQLFSHPKIGTILITGGDTLRQCMDYMGVHGIEPLCELDSGVVLSRFEYSGVTRYVISKSGGFGSEDLFIRLSEKISGQSRK